MRPLGVVLALLWVAPVVSVAQQSAAPRYEVFVLPSVQDAQKSLATYQAELQANGNRTDYVECGDSLLAGSRCVKSEGRDLVLPPVPSVGRQVLRSVANDPSALLSDAGWGLAWLPENLVQDGSGLADDLARLRSKPINCRNGTCWSIEYVFDSDRPGQWAYGFCERPQGVPQAGSAPCVALATRFGDRWWYLARPMVLFIGGGGRPDFAYFVRYKPGSGARFRKHLQNVLAASPWELGLTAQGRDLLATAERRPSKIVRGLRELLTVHFGFDGDDSSDPDTISFVISTTLYINELNTSAPEDWHFPKPEVEQAYLSALKVAIRNALLAECTKPSWQDDHALDCTQG